MGRPRSHDDATRDALLREAEKRLAQGGPDAISVRGVADAIGTTTRAVYSLFGSREGLLSALYQRAWRALTERVEAVPESKDPEEDLVRIGIEGFRAYALAHPNLFRFAFERIVPIDPTPEDLAAGRDAFLALERRVRRCIDAGLFGRRDSIAVAFAFHATCQGLASTELHGWLALAKDPPLATWEDALRSFLAGLRATKDERRSSRHVSSKRG